MMRLSSLTWNLRIRDIQEIAKTVLNSEVVLFLRYISMYWIDIGAAVVALNSHGVPISQVVLMTGFAVFAEWLGYC